MPAMNLLKEMYRMPPGAALAAAKEIESLTEPTPYDLECQWIESSLA